MNACPAADRGASRRRRVCRRRSRGGARRAGLAGRRPRQGAGPAHDVPAARPRADVSAASSPPRSAGPTTIAFFNYTDYEHNALRIARLRLFGEWRVIARRCLRRRRGADRERRRRSRCRRCTSAGGRGPRATSYVQAGRIPPVIGAFPRAAPTDATTSVIGVPLAYQYLTSLRPDALPAIDGRPAADARPGLAAELSDRLADGRTGLPLVSAAQWDTGVEAILAPRLARRRRAPSRWARPPIPVVRETNDGPDWSGRAACTLPAGLTFGVSGARGAVDRATASSTCSRERPRGIRSQTRDRRRRRVRARTAGSSAASGSDSAFELPIVAEPDPLDVAPCRGPASSKRATGCIRAGRSARALERLSFGDVPGRAALAADVVGRAGRSRSKACSDSGRRAGSKFAAAWQQNWRDGGRVRERGYPALQVLYWF